MKKSLFLLVAAAGIVACSQSDVINMNVAEEIDTPINFTKVYQDIHQHDLYFK